MKFIHIFSYFNVHSNDKFMSKHNVGLAIVVAQIIFFMVTSDIIN